jgi:hypothetical protein
VKEVVVMVDPPREASTELLDEGKRDFLEAAARGLRRKGDVEHDHAPFEVTRAREFAR